MIWLITGVAGFIGSHVAARLLEEGQRVVGVDNLDAYYDPNLKLARLGRLNSGNFTFTTLDIADACRTYDVFEEYSPDTVIHLAAQPGVRFAMKTVTPYARTNLMGTVNVLEASRLNGVAHVAYASSSSVYGETARVPFSEHDPANHPVSLYAATKRANEVIAHSYSHIFGLPTTGLRFFTVYGPWGRPDMAYYSFARSIARREPITIFGDSSALRDFTYIDDIVEGVIRIARMAPTPNTDWRPDAPDPATSPAPYRLFNIGRGRQVPLSRMIDLLEAAIGQRAERVYEPSKPGDVTQTYADVGDLERAIGFTPQVDLEDGLSRFAEWFRVYHRDEFA